MNTILQQEQLLSCPAKKNADLCEAVNFDDIIITKHKKITINGERGTLEGLYNDSGAKSISSPIVLLLHPQPNSNGSMYNKVIQESMMIFSKLGFACLTINFGGVGNSIGKIENGFGEFLDASSAFKWLCDLHPYARHRLIFGFSFGAYIAAQLTMRRPEIDNFIYVSTPIDIYDFTFFSPVPTRGLVVHASGDKIVPEKRMLNFYSKSDRGLNVMYSRSSESVSHFYTNIDFKNVLGQPIYEFVWREINSNNLRLINDFEGQSTLINYIEYLDISGLRDEQIAEESNIVEDVLIMDEDDELEEV